MGVSSPVRTRTPTYYLDFELEPGTSHSQRIPKGWTTFAYTLDGKTVFEGGTLGDIRFNFIVSTGLPLFHQVPMITLLRTAAPSCLIKATETQYYFLISLARNRVSYSLPENLSGSRSPSGDHLSCPRRRRWKRRSEISRVVEMDSKGPRPGYLRLGEKKWEYDFEVIPET